MQIDLKSLARLGAETRLAELIAEVDAILAAFPDLGSTVARRRKRGGDGPLAKAEVPKPAVRRPKMTASQKKAVSIRMKKYWAERRKK
jgi:hypothetical protein